MSQPWIEGRFEENVITATVDLICQRCLEPMELTLSSDTKLALISETQAALADHYDLAGYELIDDFLLPLPRLLSRGGRTPSLPYRRPAGNSRASAG